MRKYLGNTYYEKNLNLAISKILRSELRKAGAIVATSRMRDVKVRIDRRYITANNWKADLFISIHHNSSSLTRFLLGTNGTEAIYPKTNGYPRKYDSKKLATYVNGSVAKHAKFKNRGTYQDSRGLAVLRGTKMPAIILEAGYMASDSDMRRAIYRTSQIRTAKAIANGLRDYCYWRYVKSRNQTIIAG